MTNVAAGLLVVRNDGKILMVQERQTKHRGKWSLPGGTLEKGESIVACAEREGHEETGLLFQCRYLVGIYQQYSTNGFSDNKERQNRIGFIFFAESTGGKLSLADEIMAADWFSMSEIERLCKEGRLRNPYIPRVIRDFQGGKKIPLDCITVF